MRFVALVDVVLKNKKKVGAPESLFGCAAVESTIYWTGNVWALLRKFFLARLFFLRLP